MKTIVKYAKGTPFLIAALISLAFGLATIHALPEMQDNKAWGWIAVAVLLLAIGALFTGLSYVSFCPDCWDYRPVVNVSSLCAPCGLARTLARLGAAS
jgi:hypothetical protein